MTLNHMVTRMRKRILVTIFWCVLPFWKTPNQDQNTKNANHPLHEAGWAIDVTDEPQTNFLRTEDPASRIYPKLPEI